MSIEKRVNAHHTCLMFMSFVIIYFLKAALIHIFYTNNGSNDVIICNVKDVATSEEPTETYRPTMLFLSFQNTN